MTTATETPKGYMPGSETTLSLVLIGIVAIMLIPLPPRKQNA